MRRYDASPFIFVLSDNPFRQLWDYIIIIIIIIFIMVCWVFKAHQCLSVCCCFSFLMSLSPRGWSVYYSHCVASQYLYHSIIVVRFLFQVYVARLRHRICRNCLCFKCICFKCNTEIYIFGFVFCALNGAAPLPLHYKKYGVVWAAGITRSEFGTALKMITSRSLDDLKLRIDATLPHR